MSDRPAILVTGGAGYIGAHACRALAGAGYNPVVYDNLSTGHADFVAGPLVVADILDKTALARTFAEYEIAAVMHFAAASLVGESVIDPQKYYANNVAGTLSLLEAMRKAGCHRLVFSSTGAVYGQADSKALPENYGICPQRSTRDVTITRLVRRLSPAWRNERTPPASMRSSCFAGWTAHQKVSCRVRRMMRGGPSFRMPVLIKGFVGIFKNFMTRWTSGAVNGC